jgi:hypothetical protein
MLESFGAFGFKPKSTRRDGTGMWKEPPRDLKYDRVRFDSLKTDKDEVFRFIWDNRGPLELQDGAYTEVLSVQPSTRIGVDGFVVRETVAQYYQVARLTPDELRAVGIRLPRDYERALRARESMTGTTTDSADNHDTHDEAPRPPQDVDELEAKTTPIYGGGILIFNEFGRVKYFVCNNVFAKRQSQRLAYLWREGILQPGGRSSRLRATRLSTLHRLRALQAAGSAAQRW